VTPWPRLARNIVVDDVSYEYGDGRGHALRHVRLRVERGASVGIVGATGAGKSTLVDVVLGLLPPAAGRVLADGCDIATNVRGWQMQIGYVAQHVSLIDDSLRRNIAFGFDADEIDEARVARAASEARLDDLIAALPEGLDARVGEHGIRLSGGERQRIAIARALYRDPAVLLFDEATSALDQATEREIVRAIDELRGERTVIVIAHRMSTVRGCDRIVVLDAGCVVAEGRFDELRLQSDLFRSLSAGSAP
jgi:ATP-binding cassette subfamily C protein